jgi:hypothetical protein
MVTLMGVHTFGCARPNDSGYAGMWTQSKGQFNSEYLQHLVQVLPVICAAGRADLGDVLCIVLSGAILQDDLRFALKAKRVDAKDGSKEK